MFKLNNNIFPLSEKSPPDYWHDGPQTENHHQDKNTDHYWLSSAFDFFLVATANKPSGDDTP